MHVHTDNGRMEKRVEHRQEVGEVEGETDPYDRPRGSGEDQEHVEVPSTAMSVSLEDGTKGC
jgi:hypothetical protein